MGETVGKTGSLAEMQRLMELQRQAQLAAEQQRLAAQQQRQADPQPAAETPAAQPAAVDTLDKTTFVDNVRVNEDGLSKAELEKAFDQYAGEDKQLSNEEFEQFFLDTVTRPSASEQASKPLDDTEVAKMMGQLSDADLDQLPAARREQMIAALGTAFLKGNWDVQGADEQAMMGRLGASLARTAIDPARLQAGLKPGEEAPVAGEKSTFPTPALLAQMGPEAAAEMAKTLTARELATLEQQQPGTLAALDKAIGDGTAQVAASAKIGRIQKRLADKRPVEDIDPRQSSATDGGVLRTASQMSGLTKTAVKANVDTSKRRAEIDKQLEDVKTRRETERKQAEDPDAPDADPKAPAAEADKAPADKASAESVSKKIDAIKKTIDFINAGKAPGTIEEGSEAAKKLTEVSNELYDLVAKNPAARKEAAALFEKMGGIAGAPAGLVGFFKSSAGILSGLNADGKPMSTKELTQAILALPGQAGDAKGAVTALWPAIKSIANAVPGLDKVATGAEQLFTKLADFAAKGQTKIANALEDVALKVLANFVKEGGEEAALKLMGNLLMKANIAFTAVTTAVEITQWMLENIYAPAKAALTEGLSSMKWGGADPNVLLQRLDGLRDAAAASRAQLEQMAKAGDTKSPEYKQVYEKATADAKAVDAFIKDHLVDNKDAWGAYMNTVSNGFERAIAPLKKDPAFMKAYTADPRSPEDEMKVAKALGPVATDFIKAEIRKDGEAVTGVNPDDLTGDDIAGMDEIAATKYLMANEAKLDQLTQPQKLALIEKLQSVAMGVIGNGENYQAMGKLMAAYVKGAEDPQVAWREMEERLPSWSQTDVMRAFVGALDVKDLAKLGDARTAMMAKVPGWWTSATEGQSLGKIAASYVASGQPDQAQAILDQYEATDQDSGLTATQKYLAGDDVALGLIQNLSEAQIAALPEGLRKQAIAKIADTISGMDQPRLDAIAKICNAQIRAANGDATKIQAAVDEAYATAGVTDNDDLALAITKDLTRAELALLPAAANHTLHKAVSSQLFGTSEANQNQANRLKDART